MRKFWVLLKKEVRELATPQMLVPFVITVLMFVAIGNVVGDQGEQAQQSQRVGVVDLDDSDLSAAVISAVESADFQIVVMSSTDGETLVDDLKAENLQLGMIIPAGFAASATSGEQPEIQTYAVVRGFSVIAAQSSQVLGAVLDAANGGLSDQLIAAELPGSDPETLKQPLAFSEHVVLGDATAAVGVDQVMGFVMQQTTFIPVVLFIVIVFAAQMIATTIASEKENKTLETLLSSPVSRASLVTAKMVAAALIALLSAAAYMFGLNYYMQGLQGGLGGNGTEMAADFAGKLGLALGTQDWILMGLSLFASILVALSIAVILGAFAENVKAVQSLLAPLMIFVMIPYFLTLFVDINQAGPVLKWGVLAIPFAHSFSAAPNLFLNNYTQVIAGIAYQFAWFTVLVAIAARIFSTDRILTMKLDLRRKKR